MSDAVSQHVVPQVYLKRFADERTKRILIVRRANASGIFVPPRTASVKKAAAYDDFYTYRTPDGGRDEAIEKQLSVFEGRFSTVYKALRSPFGVTPDIRRDIKSLAVLQYSRGLHQRDFWTMWHALQELDGGSTFLDSRDELHMDEIRSYLALANNASDARDRGDQFARTAIPIAFDVIGDIFKYLHMCLLTSDAHDFFTCDQPVVFFDPTVRQANTWGKYPYYRLPLEITYPLTKRYCVLFAWMPLPGEARATADVVTTVNARTAYTCVQEVFTTPFNAPIDKARFSSDLTNKEDFMKRPLLWKYLARKTGGITLRSAIRASKLDEADVLQLKVPLWWWRGLPDMSPELMAALQTAKDSQSEAIGDKADVAGSAATE